MSSSTTRWWLMTGNSKFIAVNFFLRVQKFFVFFLYFVCFYLFLDFYAVPITARIRSLTRRYLGSSNSSRSISYAVI